MALSSLTPKPRVINIAARAQIARMPEAEVRALAIEMLSILHADPEEAKQLAAQMYEILMEQQQTNRGLMEFCYHLFRIALIRGEKKNRLPEIESLLEILDPKLEPAEMWERYETFMWTKEEQTKKKKVTAGKRSAESRRKNQQKIRDEITDLRKRGRADSWIRQYLSRQYGLTPRQILNIQKTWK
jgi:hypothetical protein